MPDATLRSAVDTYVTSGQATTNYGAAKSLAIGAATTYSYLYFTRPMPLRAVVVSAKLRLFYDTPWTGTVPLVAQRLASTIAMSRVTWNTKPNVTGSVSPTTNAAAGPAGTMVEIDVTAIMQSVADGAAWYGLRVSTTGSIRRFTSVEGTSAQRPQLYVQWSEQPHAPTSLTPDGNDAVSVTKPVLRFQVLDTLGDTTIAAVNVQIATNTTFTAGLWDSGWVATDDPQLDLATTAYPGLGGGSVYWRVRVKDGAGLVSAWSDDAQMRYVAKGALVINSPAPGSPAYVNDPTAPIIWTFSGVQVQWQVDIYLAVFGPVRLATSGRRTNTENTWTIPPGVLTAADVPYRVRVQIWDNIDRDPTDAVTEQTVQFVYTHDAGVLPVTELTVTQPDPWPSVQLTWSRGSAPDQWVIERDGKVLEANLDPADALVSGTTYAFEDEGAQSWRPHTWKVRAKVNGKVSDSAAVTYTPTLRGIWLMDKGRNIRVWIAGADDGMFAEPEDATSVAPLGSAKVVRLVQGVRNYEGNITGRLVDAFGRSMAAYHNGLVALRAEPTRPVTLALADYTLRVLIGNVQLAPTAPHVPPSRVVSFDFWEV